MNKVDMLSQFGPFPVSRAKRHVENLAPPLPYKTKRWEYEQSWHAESCFNFFLSTTKQYIESMNEVDMFVTFDFFPTLSPTEQYVNYMNKIYLLNHFLNLHPRDKTNCWEMNKVDILRHF